MKKLLIRTLNIKIIAVFLLAILCVQFLLPAKAQAASNVDYVDDQAGLLTQSEHAQLLALINRVISKRETNVAIVTVPDRGSKTPKRFMEDYIDEKCDAKIYSEDVVIIFLSMADRWVEIQGYGKGETYITDERVDKILDDIEYDLRRGHYYQAFSDYVNDVDDYLKSHPNPFMHTGVQILIALVISGIITAVMVSHSGGKVTTNNRTYLDSQHSGLTARRDIYLTTTVRRIHRPPASSSGGGGRSGGFSGGGRSSGGRSHSGGGRHF